MLVAHEADSAREAGSSGRRSLGVVARVLRTAGHASGNYSLVLRGLGRVRMESVEGSGAFPTARASALPPSASEPGPELAERLRDTAREVIALRPELPGEAAGLVDAVPDPAALADLVAANLELSLAERLTILETVDAQERTLAVLGALDRARDALRRRQAAITLGSPEALRQPWPFAPDGAARLAERERAGTVTAAEAADLRHFVEHGYVVWEGLVEPALVDALVADVRGIGAHPGHFVTTNHRNALPYRFSGTDFDAYESIYDLYVNFESSRRVCFHPRILRFLELLFDARPVAFQQLLFQRSNGHPLHQDTAYVCVEEPLLLAATWVALEDVVPGRGELTYFDGSHRIPHHFFADGSKRFHPARDDAAAFSHHIDEQCAALGCAKRDFIAKKGDVFLWAADLVHGSNPRTLPEEETRMSCVTHYCPETTTPFWFRMLPENRQLQACGERAWIASSYYRLPAPRDALARPNFHLPAPPG